MNAPLPQHIFNDWTFADAISRFGAIPITRVRHQPLPGTAILEDVVRIREQERRLCELIDGVLVEKTRGSLESAIALRLAMWIGRFVELHQLGCVLGADGMLELSPDQVRIPDVSFLSNAKLRTHNLELAIWSTVPDLAVEVISRGNSAVEMERKLVEYFAAGVVEVWYIEPELKSLRMFRSPTDAKNFRESDTFRESSVLPGLEISLGRLFAKPGA